MNESDANFDGNNAALRNEVQGLRNTLTLTLLFAFIFSFCVNVFLYLQGSVVSAQAGEAQQIVGTFQSVGAQQVVDFWGKLNDYAKTHPDFTPVLQKYSSFLNIHSSANSGAAAPKK